MTLLQHITVDHGIGVDASREETQGPRCSVIWMHGLGADGHDFESLVPHLRLPEELSVRFIFPHAEVRPVTLNAGMPMRAWYDIVSLEGARDGDMDGVRKSSQQIEALIDQERQRGVPASRILLAGFSQGGAMAYQVGLRYPEQLLGILVLSAYLIDDTDLGKANLSTPILQCHGSYDPVVPMSMGEGSYRKVKEAGFAVTWKSYPVDHSLDAGEVRDVSEWLQQRLASCS